MAFHALIEPAEQVFALPLGFAKFVSVVHVLFVLVVQLVTQRAHFSDV